jgi:tetratricopeptide (TPR) repeat protein
LEPQNPKVLEKRAQSYFFAKNYLFSLKDFISLVDIDKNNSGAYFLMGRIHLGLGKFSQSLEDFENSLRINPGNKDTLEKLQMAKSAINLNEKLEKLLQEKNYKEAIGVLGLFLLFNTPRHFNIEICEKSS